EKEIERKQRSLADAQRSIEETHLRLQGRENALCSELESIAGLTQEEAKAALIERIRSDVQKDAARLTRHIMQQAEDEAEDRCKRLLATTINRLAVPCVAEATVSTVTLPSDEMKGRIIGREGRNIRAFEKATGVTIVIDDTPGAVVVSSFDPVRRHVAKMALGDLLLDGRIHPTRIEEVVQKAQELTAQQIRQYGEDAALRAGVSDLHPALIQLLGRLKFRFSYAQNVLEHSLEVSHLLGMMAAELGLDQAFARRVGLLHDMGKAVSHEMEGTHAVIGHDLALKYGESPEVANGIGCHHGEMEPITIVGSLCGAADAISASRPGARTEAVEEYVKRVRRLESIAGEFPGVENVYALQAGKELRIMVLPDMIDDDGCLNLARDISKRIEGALSYPGQIKVTVIREKRAIHYAS
ncbi:MAG: ribonuclease Y, partial [Chlamydiia bacterium]|nr:ribonuclease Y [Chlamydiia bacterium]